MTAGGWTVPDALAQFAEAGMPVDEAGFRAVVRAAQRTGTIRRTGETRAPLGSKGGRGRPLYDIGQLQQLHKDLAKWIPAQDRPPAI